MRFIKTTYLPILLASLCLSCGPEASIPKSAVDEIQYSKADYLHELGTYEGLDEDTEWQIVQAYHKKLQSDGEHDDFTINDVRVEQFYGVYCPLYLLPDSYGNEVFWETVYKDPKNQTVYAVRIGEKSMDNGSEPRDDIIRVYSYYAVIRYYDNSAIFLWDKGHLYDIEKDDSPNNTLLTAWDLRKIINRHNGLDVETDTMIRENISGKDVLGQLALKYPDEINLKFLGAYNGYTVLTMYSGVLPILQYQRIDGVLFLHPYFDDRVFAWKEGEIYALEDLYAQNLITREDLVEMAYFFNPTKWGE